MPNIRPRHRGWKSNWQDQTHGSERYPRDFDAPQAAEPDTAEGEDE